MRLFIGILLAGLSLCGPANLSAAPQLLENLPLESPEGTYTANVEWDDAGFIGRIRMLIYDKGETPIKSVELPQMKPAPANLTWISDNWVACESFVAEQGAAFFYMDVARERGYLIEILAPEKDGDWFITFTTNDDVSSNSIHTIARGHSSIFPILLRELPTEGLSYLSSDFAYLMADAVDSYVQWRKKQGFTNLEFLTPMAENAKVGRLAVMSFDNVAEIVYFPQKTTTTREMLALTQRQKLPAGLQTAIRGVDPPKLKIEWIGDSGEFSITNISDDAASTGTELVRGRFEGVSDAVYTGPGVAALLQESRSPEKKSDSGKKSDKDSGNGDEDDSDKKESTSKKFSSKSSSKSSSSKSKKPSRSK